MSTKVTTEKDQKIDPVCNMVVSSDSQYHYYYANKDYYFCSEHCLHKFKDHPEQYINKESPPSLETHGNLVPESCTP
jgi:Cu+-exporting ATPase